MTENQNDENNNHSESFADLFEAYGGHRNGELHVGDRIQGEVISIGEETVFVDTGTKIDGVVEVQELIDEEGNLKCDIGDVLELYVVAASADEIRLSKALSGRGSAHLLEEAFRNGVPVEGKIKAQCKGGFEVEVMKKRAFCPLSQIDIQYVDDPGQYVGQSTTFAIIQFEEDGRNIVLSRRRILEKELDKVVEAFYEETRPGDTLEGRVTKLMPYGAFVELLPGLEGMIHLSELSWSKVKKPEEVLSIGDKVMVKIIEMEPKQPAGKARISLSIRQTVPDPWETVLTQFSAGDRVKGKVTRCADFGAFVEVASGIEGLVHISEMSYKKRVLRVSDEVEPGQTVPVVIKEVDPERRRISLSIRDAEGDPWMEIQDKYQPGQTVRGILEKKETFGYFINLEPGITGLLHVSQIRDFEDPTRIEKLKPGDPLDVVIQAINPPERKMSFTPAGAKETGDWKRFAGDKNTSMGSLGEKLKEALKDKEG